MKNLIRLDADPITRRHMVGATRTAIQTKLQQLAKMPPDGWSTNDLLDYSQLMIYQDRLNSVFLRSP